MENFEALGRYHFAQEQLSNNASIRERLLDELKGLVDKAVGKPIGKPTGNFNLDFPFPSASKTVLLPTNQPAAERVIRLFLNHSFSNAFGVL